MDKVSCVIVEDDEISMTMVVALAERTGLLDVCGTFSTAEKAIHWLADHEVDLLFLDVEMPGMTGLDMLRSLYYKPEVIIISGKPHYALEAFDMSVTDYLLKPIKDYHRFLGAVNKVIVKRRSNTTKQPSDDNLFVKVESLLLKLDIATILFIEAFGDYIKIHTIEKIYTVYSTLKKLEEKLDNKKFVRVHRSYIVNISKITNIDPNNLEINKKIIPISGTYKEELMSRISVL
jgi:DNA-binding LytR/AlgR family response regulator